MNVLTQSQVAAYHEKGYLFPLPALSPEELKSTADRFRHDANGGPGDQDLRKMQEFTEALDAAKNKIYNTFVTGLTPLTGRIGGLADTIARAIEKIEKWLFEPEKQSATTSHPGRNGLRHHEDDDFQRGHDGKAGSGQRVIAATVYGTKTPLNVSGVFD